MSVRTTGVGEDGLYYFPPKAWIYDPVAQDIFNGQYHADIARKNALHERVQGEDAWKHFVYGWYDNLTPLIAPESDDHPFAQEGLERATQEAQTNPIFRESKIANIFDPIETNLDQRIFDGITPRTSVIKFIQRLYYHALDRKLGVTGTEWADLYFTGSLTTYQFSQTSDADISVFPDYDRIYKHLGIDPMSARRMLIEMSIHFLDGTFLPGTQHPLQFFVVPYGTLPQDLYQPGLRSAYNVLDRHWIVPPERERSHNVMDEMPEAYERAEEIADKLKTMLDNGSYDEARELWHNVHAKRQLDQRAGLGDYCEGNIVYKWLLHEGLFDRIRDELGEFIAKVAVDWDNGSLDPRLLDVEREHGGMVVWEKLEQQVEELAEQYHCSIWWLPRNMAMFAECVTNYDASQGWGKDQIQLSFNIKIPKIRGEVSYYIALHEIGHAAFRKKFYQDIISLQGSQEEEAWATHFVLENSQIEFSQATLEQMQKNMGSYEHTLPMKSPMQPNWFHSAVDYSDGMGINGPSIGDYQFRMPPEIENRYIEAMECPSCGGHLRREETGKIYCEQCGWRPHQSGVDHLWDERVTTKVIYDFDADRIVLGTQATLPDLKSDAKIVGEYVNGKVTLYEADKQWINPTYFRRLWHVSYPDKELKDVYFRRESGDEYKLRSLPRTRKKATTTGIAELDALITEFRNVQVEDLKGQITIDDLKDPKIAEGLCHTFSLKFADFVKQNGYEAWLPKYGTGTPEAIGYDDRAIKGRTGHYWTYVKADGRTFGIDWTAAQFGYEDIPLVQELTESGWIRHEL